ncbi:N-acyl homoserine lactone hydrolase [Bradyrhizobium japonicum]|jgi:glyoxylase-like metal-dependent hydrolase (beta-lactamase superfamily II)|uniref:N-acyl homoserine lactonase family protein n=1 Tax=Bradyrhizobium TaxID=374 RepID=UPI00040869B9|nr:MULTISPECIES: N-acyl homoserine lactonase family protein [Bradyrhizobium]MBR0880734.1 N-acyl homoserine lactonase family protein [Bradyrhizobium liaoningense]MBR1000605.1 N-acyl homoserine lactonase family protein [Bradyrhizobium liaoningense]MBR1030672.1 N-acyl homoserine lactonase family protein [Bradyrhizobium liaoningense]MBR1066850.1 N-acyl homoserine lactonase family protein [Bradyrhizobium liaoningense]MCP1742076.1 glyoxylase-like metal-dependent hydrolase (beta-lactamase superfamily
MMPRIKFALAVAALALSGHAAVAQSEKSGVEKLYVLNCGEGTAGDISRWTPGLNEGKSMDFVDSCYLIKHSSKGWFLWDTGIADAVAAMPNGLVPADPKAVTWRRPKTLAAQLEQLGLKPDDVKAMAVSHTHPDHTGNVELFPQAMLYVQRAEYDWPGANNEPRFKPSHPVELLAGDKDVFGDGSLTILSTPGHTPGHQSLLVKLPKTGAVVLSGDAVHFRDNWDNRRVPSMNANKDQSAASMQKIADTLTKEKAQLWINHDKAQRDSQKMAPEFYD